jgi:error-prone DNA polymerase
MEYAALWCKSNSSFLEGASFPEELVRRSNEAGLSALALTDRDGVYGIVRAHITAKELGMKLIIGSQITVDDGSSVVLLCRNQTGYQNLCSLISAGRLRSPKGMSRVSWDEICAESRGLAAILPGPWGSRDGENLLVSDFSNSVSRTIPWDDLKRAFPGVLFLGYAKHHIFEDVRELQEVKAVSKERNLPVVAAPEVLYHDSERRPLQDVLTCIRSRTTLDEAGEILKSNHHYDLKSPDEYRKLYSDFPEALKNTRRIADLCTFTLDDIHYTYPTEQLPRGMSVMEWLSQLVQRGAVRRYPKGIPEKVIIQIDKELATIEKLEYGGYFLTMWDIVRFCRENGILCQGRGSAANSIVCYCLGITAVDPVQMDLLFERFLSEERAEPPDIDLDIAHQRREEVIQHMYAKYGRDRAAMVANTIRYRPKSAVRDVGRALGFSSVTLERLAKNMGAWWVDFEKNLNHLLGNEPLENRSPEEEHQDRKALLVSLCRQIMDFPRHLSIHPGGFIIGSRPIAHLVPIENAAMADRTVIQWDKYDVEAMGLFKVDLLGLGALSHLDITMRLLEEHRGIRVSLADVSRQGDDPEVFEALRRADTVGVFQIESRAQMAMLPRIRPSRFYDLVIEVSIVRPGPISGGMVHPYLRRRNGEEPVMYPHPSLEPVLKKTLGVPLFQEQVMKLAVVAAGYTPGEADQLRRDMAAWRSSGKIARHREKLISGMISKGISAEFSESVYKQIQGFGEYGFPESHAASFALIAYATAWFKVKYPAFFTCGLLNAWPMGFYSPATVIDDAKRHDVPILPIDVTLSDWDCRPEWFEPQTRWGVRMGLRYVKGLSVAQGDRIAGLRNLRISSIEEYAEKSGLDVKAMKALVLSGAFDSISGNRRSQLWHSLSPSIPQESWNYTAEDSFQFEPLNRWETVAWDYSGSRHSTLGHPMEALRSQLSMNGIPDSAGVRQTDDGLSCTYVGLVICRQRPGTANGVIFITLEDESGFVNLVIWEKTYDQYKSIILHSPLLGVKGTVQSQDGTVHLIVDECFEPDVNLGVTEVISRDFY